MYSIIIAISQKKYKGQTLMNLDVMKLKYFFIEK